MRDYPAYIAALVVTGRVVSKMLLSRSRTVSNAGKTVCGEFAEAQKGTGSPSLRGGLVRSVEFKEKGMMDTQLAVRDSFFLL